MLQETIHAILLCYSLLINISDINHAKATNTNQRLVRTIVNKTQEQAIIYLYTKLYFYITHVTDISYDAFKSNQYKTAENLSISITYGSAIKYFLTTPVTDISYAF